MKKKAQKDESAKILGKRRPILGSFFILLAIYLGVSILDYSANQDIFFKSYFESFLTTTNPESNNLGGRLGATFCIICVLSIGMSFGMLPVYIYWIGYNCWKRRPKAFEFLPLFCSVIGLFLLSIILATIQIAYYADNVFDLDNVIVQTTNFPSGWGGKIGTEIFIKILAPTMSVAGSLMLLIPLYMLCLIVVFVDSPYEAAKELLNLIKKFFGFTFKGLYKSSKYMLCLPLRLFSKYKIVRKNQDSEFEEFEVESQDTILSPSGKQKVSIKRKKKPTKESQDSVNEIDFSDVDFSSYVDNSDNEADNKALSAKKSKSEKVEFEVESEVKDDYKIKHIQSKNKDYVFPSIDLLGKPKKEDEANTEDYKARMAEIVQTIGHFSIKVEPQRATPGPVITRYEVTLAHGVRINRISNLESDISLGIKAEKVRVIAPIPGRGTVGIEVPNKKKQGVFIRDIIESKQWNSSNAEIPIVLGKDVTGVPIVLDLSKMPHALIAGSTGSGKSVCINTIIVSLLYKMMPQDLRLILIDPKVVELQIYNSLPHMLVPVVTDPRKVPAALKWLTDEMKNRYQIFSKVGVKNIAGFNAKILKDKQEQAKAEELEANLTPEERQARLLASQEFVDENIDIPKEKMPYIVCIVDELADLMMVAGKEVDGYIARLTQLARAAGIHLIVATQRPSTDVITGSIKSNLPTRIGLKTVSQIDSRTILDQKGTETLIGNGDMLFITAGSSNLVRAQGSWISDEEISSIVEALKVNGEPEYAQEVCDRIESAGEDEDSSDSSSGDSDSDPMVAKAIEVIRTNQKASTSLLQRKLGIGYGRAARIIDNLEDRGIIGPDNNGKAREIFVD